MPKFKSVKEIANYPHVEFFPFDTSYYVSVSADFDEDLTKPHALITFYPHVKDQMPSGEDEHWHVPFYQIDARRLRDWLNRFLED